KLRRKVRQDIRDLQQSLRLTVVYVTHDQEEALAVSDRIVVMRQGRIAAMGAPRELYEAPASSFVADFIGDANLINGELITLQGQHFFRADKVDVHVVPPPGMSDGPVALAIRPHRIRIGEVEGSTLTGKILRQAYLGSRLESLVLTPLGELLVFSDALLSVAGPGSTVGLHFTATDARVTARE
ncbi:MAG: ABC transporter ATP-binding protein, partial [Polaromonas sp.]